MSLSMTHLVASQTIHCFRFPTNVFCLFAKAQPATDASAAALSQVSKYAWNVFSCRIVSPPALARRDRLSRLSIAVTRLFAASVTE
jgi:hypothetical protein